MFSRSYENDYDPKNYVQRLRTSPPSPERSAPGRTGCGRDSNGGDAADIWFRLWKTHLQQSSPHLYNSAKTKSWSHTSPLPDRRAMSAGTAYRVGLGVSLFQVGGPGFEPRLPLLIVFLVWMHS